MCISSKKTPRSPSPVEIAPQDAVIPLPEGQPVPLSNDDAQIMGFFEYSHLPEHLQKISKPIAMLAKEMDEHLPDNAEKRVGFRKLLEAKDCFVRANIGTQK